MTRRVVCLSVMMQDRKRIGAFMRKSVIAALLIAVLAGAGWYGMAGRDTSTIPSGRDAEGGRPVPVVVAAVEQRTIPIAIDAIGTVQAYNTVTVRSRIDGQLTRIAFQEGQDVKAGTLLAQIDARSLQAALRQMEANVARDQAQLVSAEADLRRTTDLSSRQFATRQAVDTQLATVQQLKASIEAGRAQIDAARTQLDYATITAPIDGRTGMRLVDQGNIVRAGDATGIVTITQIQPIAAVFTVPEADLPAIQQRMASATSDHGITVTALDRTERKPLGEGELVLIDNQIDSQTGTIKLKARFPNETRTLWPGQFVNIRLNLDTVQNAIVVPAPVVQQGPKGSFAYVVRADRTVELRPVTVLRSADGVSMIGSGLKPGEQVVLDGQYRLKPDAKIEIVRVVDSGAKS